MRAFRHARPSTFSLSQAWLSIKAILLTHTRRFKHNKRACSGAGGIGTRREAENPVLLKWLSDTYHNPARPLKHLLSVCTGAGLLARAGLLDGLQATSNKLSWDWVVAQSAKTRWVEHARWVVAGNIITSAGEHATTSLNLSSLLRVSVSTCLTRVDAQECPRAWT